MNAVRFSPIMGMLLLLLVGVALALSFSANSPKMNLGQAQGSPTPMTPQPPSPSSTIVNTTPTNTTPAPLTPTRAGITPTIIPDWTPGGHLPFDTPNPTQVARDEMGRYLSDAFYGQAGTAIARGTNTTPVSADTLPISITTYIVEEVTLPSAVTWEVLVPNPAEHNLQLQIRTFDRFWRIKVLGPGPFWTGNNIWMIWIDDNPVGNAVEARDRVMTVIFDRALLREGARIGVDYGSGPSYLPETLHIAP